MYNHWTAEMMTAMEHVWKRIFESLKSYTFTLKMITQEYVGLGLQIAIIVIQQLFFMCRYAGIDVFEW